MDINNQLRHYTKAFPNQTANGVLGVPADLVNTSSWSVSQSTVSISLTLAIPSSTLAATKLRLWVSNIGIVPVTIEGIVIPVKGEAQFYFEGTAWALTGFSAKSTFNPTFGTISDTVATGNTNAVANWGYLADGTPIPTDRVYYAETAGNINKTVSVANLKALLAAPDEIVDVSGATLPITYPVTTIPGVPVFAPNTPASTTAIYAITDGTSISYAKWNGTQFIGSAAPVAPADFFRSGTVASPLLPDGTNDPSENISRIGKTGFGTGDPSLVKAAVDCFGTLTTRGLSQTNGTGLVSLSGSIPNVYSIINIIKNTVDGVLSIGAPTGQLELGRFFRVHNDSASTNNILYQDRVAKPGTFLDLQWNGTAWASEAFYASEITRFSPLSLVNGVAIGGTIPASAQIFVIQDGDYSATLNLPPITSTSEELTIVSRATSSAIIATTNQIAGAVAQTINLGQSLSFVPSTAGWVLKNATLINGGTRFQQRGTFAVPLTGAIAVSTEDELLIVGTGSITSLPTPALFPGRRLNIKKPGAGTANINGSIDGGINLSLFQTNESVTLHCDGATWVRI
jgi:hypothetical protein